MYDNRDTVIGQYRSDKAFICFFRFQRTARQTDITPSFRNGGYAGAGTGGIVCKLYAVIRLHKSLAQCTDNLCRDCCKNLYQKPFECCVFHVRYLLLSFIFFVVVSLSDVYNDKARM